MADWEKLKSEAKGVLYHLYGFFLDRKEWWDYRKKFINELADHGNLVTRIIASPPRNYMNWVDEKNANRIRESEVYNADIADAVVKAETILRENHQGALDAVNGTLAKTRKEIKGEVSSRKEFEALLNAERLTSEELTQRVKRADIHIRTLQNDTRLVLGQHLMDESPCGIIILDENSQVIGANANACRYTHTELKDMSGMRPSEVFADYDFAKRYCELFEGHAVDLARAGKTLPPNTLKIEKAPFDIMAYATSTGSREMGGKYTGGFIVLNPFKPETVLEKVFKRSPSSIVLEGDVTFDDMMDTYLPVLMNSKTQKPFYIDLEGVNSITTNALDSLGKFYQVFANRKIACVFKNATYDVAQYLIDNHGINSDFHMRDVQFSEKTALAFGKG